MPRDTVFYVDLMNGKKFPEGFLWGTAISAFQVEMAWRASKAGMKITEIPIRFRDRETGASKMSTSIALEAMGLVTRWGRRRRFGGASSVVDR